MTRRTRGRIARAILAGTIVGTAIVAGIAFVEDARNAVSPEAMDTGSEVAVKFDPQRFTVTPRAVISEAEKAEAVALNAAIPVIDGARVAAAPFFFDPALPPTDRLRAEHCLALAVYYEAASESITGQRAVAQVVLNRVRHPTYPRSVCGVVFEGSWRPTGCQFTFTCDGSLARTPSQAGWRRARGVAQDALAGLVEPSAGTATHYHTDWVAPVWRTELVKLAQIGTHIFYRWPGRAGTRAAFALRYRGGEAFDPGLPSIATVSQDSAFTADAAPVAVEPTPSPIIADDVRHLPDAKPDAGKAAPQLRADEERGMLTAEERKLPATL